MGALLFVVALIGALIGLLAAMRRGFSALVGVIAGGLLGPFAVLLFLVRGNGSTGRRCPYCQEFVQPTAVVCRHCARDLTPFMTGAR